MPRVIAMSSFVAHGGVGLRAILAAMSHAAIDVVALPTIVLSSHLGHGLIAGPVLAASEIARMADALDASGALRADAVLTGFLPTPAHVAVAADLIARVRAANPHVLVLVDPILGDDPGGLYIDAAAAAALRDTLVPIADLVTPNRFELSFLSGVDVSDQASAVKAARHLNVPAVIATSVPSSSARLENLLIEGDDVMSVPVDRAAVAAHGTGDLFAACLLSVLLHGQTRAQALHHAVAAVAHAIALSGDDLDLALADIDWKTVMSFVAPRA